MPELPALELLDIREVDQTSGALPNWDLSSTQLESGSQETFHHQLVYDDLHIMHFRESHAIVHEYRPPPDTTVFGLFTPRSPLQRWCGIEIPHEVLLIHPNGRDCVACYPAGFRSIGIVVPNGVLDELEILPERWLQGREISTRCLVPVTEAGRSFASWLYRVFESTDDLRLVSSDPLAATLFQERVFEGLAVLLGRSAPSGNGPVVTSNFRRYGLASRALDLIDRKLTEPLSTRDIAAELEVSPRVLQYAFRDVLQATPYGFVLKRKLHAVRQKLLDRSAGEIGVTEVAAKYGFTEMGRFSQRYRQMFGELPSATKTRPRARSSRN